MKFVKNPSMIFGFSTGALYKFYTPRESLSVLRDAGIYSVELCFNLARIRRGLLDEIIGADLEDFEYVSVHAPAVDYVGNKEAEEILKKIERLNKERTLDLVVFHPDQISDFSIFDGVSFRVAFENMDYRKKSFKRPEEFTELLFNNASRYLVLDVNHIYTNDSSMDLASEYYDAFGDRIKEVHLSGFQEVHDPLFQTEQIMIIKAIKDFNIPIIVESTLMSPKMLPLERDYILRIVNSLG